VLEIRQTSVCLFLKKREEARGLEKEEGKTALENIILSRDKNSYHFIPNIGGIGILSCEERENPPRSIQ